MCYQASALEGALGDNTEQSEDCLTLNIFTNRWALGRCRTLHSVLYRLDAEKPLAVMVWIHGGGFTLGGKDIYRMQAIIDKDVVLVAINYRSCLTMILNGFKCVLKLLCCRLHALGFLSFGNRLVSINTKH